MSTCVSIASWPVVLKRQESPKSAKSAWTPSQTASEAEGEQSRAALRPWCWQPPNPRTLAPQTSGAGAQPQCVLTADLVCCHRVCRGGEAGCRSSTSCSQHSLPHSCGASELAASAAQSSRDAVQETDRGPRLLAQVERLAGGRRHRPRMEAALVPCWFRARCGGFASGAG